MMSNIKKYLSLMKYGYQFKLNLLLGIAFMVFGIIQLLFLYNNEANSSNIMIMLMVGPMCIVQSLATLEIANGVKASPFFSKVYKDFPKYINIICIMIIDIVYICVKLYQAKSNDEMTNSLGIEFFSCGILLIIAYVYIALSYRIFVVGTIICIPCMLTVMSMNMFGLKIIQLTTKQGILSMIVCSVVAIILYEILHRAVYKMPISRYSTGAFLRKYI